MNLLTGKKQEKRLKTFWEVWTSELKVSFPKAEFIKALADRWGLTERVVRIRLAKMNFPSTTQDIAWMYDNFNIGFSMEKGFFFDQVKQELQEKNELMEGAAFFGMSK